MKYFNPKIILISAFNIKIIIIGQRKRKQTICYCIII